MQLSELDKQILNSIQTDFPICSRPYLHIANQLGASEEVVFQRVQLLKDSGFIRRLGGIFDSKKLGFETTLVALQVRPEKLTEVGDAVSALRGVTHNYQREHSFNLWFTLTAASKAELLETLTGVSKYPGVVKMRNLPAVALYKIGVNFKL